MQTKLIITSIATTIFLSGCGASIYEQPYWKANSEKSDWDIDSLGCEEKARIAEADAHKLAENQAITNSLQNINSQLTQHGGKDFSAVYGLLGGLMNSSAHSSAKSDTFIECMKNKRWSVKEEE
ncbi:hypothetical protein SPBRAN_131 [uncultured Candidatus Thioglobus sp.]|nr:hypothetical protein SPBRAN_131 [uncultured Candidatus Thioglobus sp.]